MRKFFRMLLAASVIATTVCACGSDDTKKDEPEIPEQPTTPSEPEKPDTPDTPRSRKSLKRP